MRKEGASRAEIQETVQQLLKGYGIDPTNSDKNTDIAAGNPVEGLEVQNFPNPFNPETTIKYDLFSDTQVNIQIFDIQGKRIRSLLDEYQTSGIQSIRWDGKNDSGSPVPSGVYFLHVTAGSETVSKRIVMTK
jgi:hypothetical protein